MKGYLSIFICMSTGAMHLEFVSGLTTSAFLNAFKRLVNRRGQCSNMYSDNGTNFTGADKILRGTIENCLNDQNSHAYFTNTGITWHFNPPSAPHMGGYWEAAVKRVKYHLKRALTDALLTFEEFSTLLTEIEACVNSRPLYYNVSNVNGYEVLTPGHFIVGEPIISLPEINPNEFKGNLQERWQLISSIRQHFWRRWRDDYLVNLQKRSQWFRESSTLKEGDVVAIIDEHTPPTKWNIARVTECHPGADNRVRVATLKTADGVCVRPIVKLCKLPTADDLNPEHY